MLEIHTLEQLLLETFRKRFHVHIVAISAPLATAINILLAFGIKKVGHWRIDSTDLLSIEKPTVYTIQCILRIFFISIFHIDVAYDMIP
jgi:hypothetical protein